MTYKNMETVEIERDGQKALSTRYSFERVWKSKGWKLKKKHPLRANSKPASGGLPDVDDGSDTKAETKAATEKKEGAK